MAKKEINPERKWFPDEVVAKLKSTEEWRALASKKEELEKKGKKDQTDLGITDEAKAVFSKMEELIDKKVNSSFEELEEITNEEWDIIDSELYIESKSEQEYQENEPEGINPTEQEFEDVWSNGKPEEQSEESELEEDQEKPKMTFSEKRAMSAQDKLRDLREKISENSPKTILGKKLAMARLNRLQNMVDKRILKNNIKAMAKSDEYSMADKYNESQQSLMDEISDLSLDREDIIRELRRLDRFDPNSNKSIFAEQQKKMAKSMPKGYKATRSENSNARVIDQKRQLENKLREIDQKIENIDNMMRKNDELYKDNIAEIKANKKESLAVVKSPNIFKRIKDFFNKKVEQFKAWREDQRNKAGEELSDTVANTEKSSKREMFLKSNASNISLEEQAKYSQEIQEELEAREANNDKTQENDRDGHEQVD